MGRRHLSRYLLSFSLSALGAGCIMYVPDSWTHSPREERATAIIPQIVPGHTTKAEVLLTLGEPDEVSSDERRLIYGWSKVKVFAIGPPTGGGAMGKQYRLILFFDDRGVVLRQELERGWFMDR